MTAKHDYIPHNDADFDRWFKFLNQYVTQKCTGSTPAWTHIPAPARTALQDAYAAWYTAWSKTAGPHTKVDTEAKNDAKKAAEQAARPFVNQYLRFPPVTNEDRTAMEIHNPDLIRTPIPAPDTRPEFAFFLKDIRRIGVDFWDQGQGGPGGGKAKPYGYQGAVIYWLVSAAAPADPGELTNSVLATRTPHVLEFAEPQRGQTVYLALRWQNEKGEKGPWSEIQSTVIP
jgi:hypothetical protein